MSRYYFAYGSNMDAKRMQQRNLCVERALKGSLQQTRLIFNKRASNLPDTAYANITFCQSSCVEGVLYELASSQEVAKLDTFEGTPRRYSRELFIVGSPEGEIPAWVYVANAAWLDNRLKPAAWYVEHLLAGAPYLSDAYLAMIRATETIPGLIEPPKIPV